MFRSRYPTGALSGLFAALSALLACVPGQSQPRVPTGDGIRLGGMGCGYVTLLSTGGFGGLTINGNRTLPVPSGPECFAAVWTSAGGKSVARVLATEAPYTLPAISRATWSSQYPTANLDFSDSALPVDIALRAFSALVPHDVANSSLPAVFLAYSVRNVARAPVEVCIALSFGNTLGVGGTRASGAFSDRTGTRIDEIAARDGASGVRLVGPPLTSLRERKLAEYNSHGQYAILVEPPGRDAAVSWAAWNSLAARPEWWDAFASQGSVQSSCTPGVEGSVHPSAVLSCRFRLRANESREIPFILAWHTPRHYVTSGREVGKHYVRGYRDATEVARYAIANRQSLYTLTREWHSLLARSTFTSGERKAAVDSLEPFVTNAVLTRDNGAEAVQKETPIVGWASGLEDVGGRMAAPSERNDASQTALDLFPSLERSALVRASAFVSSPASPDSYGNVDASLEPGQVANAPALLSSLREGAHHCRQVLRAYEATGDPALPAAIVAALKPWLIASLGQTPATLDADRARAVTALAAAALPLVQTTADTDLASLVRAHVDGNPPDSGHEPGPEDSTSIRLCARWATLMRRIGVVWNAVKQTLTVAPELDSLVTPVFMPAAWATLEWSNRSSATTMRLRIDRVTVASASSSGDSGARETVTRTLVVRAIHIATKVPGELSVALRIGRDAVRGTVHRLSDDMIAFTLSEPIILAAGQRLEATVGR